MRLAAIGGIALLVSGCVVGDRISFRPTSPQQQAIVRDGRAAIVSTAPHSRVMISPLAREQNRAARPVFVVGIQNTSNAPMHFVLANTAVQLTGDSGNQALDVISYEQVVQEIRTQQTMMIMLGAAAAGVGAYQAGRAQTWGQGYSAGALMGTGVATAGLAVNNGEASIAHFEQAMIKDHTAMPGEWFGGQIHVQAPANVPHDRAVTYRISVRLGSDNHVFDVIQAPGSR